MDENSEMDLLGEAEAVAWLKQVEDADTDPNTGNEIVLETLRQLAKQLNVSKPELHSDKAFDYIAACVVAADASHKTDIERAALALLTTNLLFFMHRREATGSTSVGPKATAFLMSTAHLAFLVGHYRPHER